MGIKQKIMKKIILGAILFCLTITVNAQQEFNKWSIDLGAGVTRIINPLSDGYRSNAFDPGQANFGVRYMFNEKFGLRLGVGYNEFKEGDNSLPYKANYYRTNLEGVVNAGNLFKFSSWTKRFNFLFHSGFGFSNLNTITPIDNSETIFNVIVGLTPQYKLSNRISLFLDFSTIFHDNQDVTFDGATNNRNATNVTASVVNTSLGVNISLGKKKENADFVEDEEVYVNNELLDIKKRLSTAENVLAGLIVQNPGTTVDKEKLITELDTRYVKKEEINKYADVVTGSNVDFIRELLNSGYINVYFNTNKTTIQEGSLNSVNYLKQFMMDNPTVSAQLIGFADETGNAEQNLQLSENRAKSVFETLVAAGIDPNRLSFSGGGIDASVTQKARQFARKVTFKIK